MSQGTTWLDLFSSLKGWHCSCFFCPWNNVQLRNSFLSATFMTSPEDKCDRNNYGNGLSFGWNPMKDFSQQQQHLNTFRLHYQHWGGIGNSNPSSWKTRTHYSYQFITLLLMTWWRKTAGEAAEELIMGLGSRAVHTDIIPWHRQGISGCTSPSVGLIRVGAYQSWNSAKCYWTDHQTRGIIISSSTKFELNSIIDLSANMRNMLNRSGPRKRRKFTEGQKSIRREKLHNKCIHQVCDQLPWACFFRKCAKSTKVCRTNGRADDEWAHSYSCLVAISKIAEISIVMHIIRKCLMYIFIFCWGWSYCLCDFNHRKRCNMIVIFETDNSIRKHKSLHPCWNCSCIVAKGSNYTHFRVHAYVVERINSICHEVSI